MSGQDQFDLTKWLMGLTADKFSETFSKLQLRRTGDQTTDFFNMLHRLAGNYTAEDFEIDSNYETLNEDQIRQVRNTLRDEVVAELAKDNMNVSRHLLAVNSNLNDDAQSDVSLVSSQHSEVSQVDSGKSSTIPKEKLNHITHRQPQANESAFDINPFSFLVANSDQFKLIPWQ